MEIISTFTKDFTTLNVYGTFDEPLFLAKEVGGILKMSNIREQISNMDSDWKVVRKIDTPGGAQETYFLKEPGLYWLLMRSNKEEAIEFQTWVFEDVLPSIRKTGQYKLQDHPVQKKLTFKIENEFDLQCKVVNFIKNNYPNSLFVSTLGENQITPQMRIKSHQLGYLKGSPDMLITNCHKSYQGFAIEFKTPKGTGVVSEHQTKMLQKYKENNWKILLTNDYDECIIQLIDYFQDIRIKCEYCSMKFKFRKTLKSHHKYFHRID